MPSHQLVNRKYHSFNQLLPGLAVQHTDKTAFEFIHSAKEIKTQSYLQLHQRAAALAVALRQYGQRGDRVILLYPDGEDFIGAFFGCLYAGRVAVPVPMPAKAAGNAWERFVGVLRNAQTEYIVTTGKGAETLSQLAFPLPLLIFTFDQLRGITLPAGYRIHYSDAGFTGDFTPEAAAEDTLAFLQYTSGSTGEPKGVMVTHGNLWANSQAIYHYFGHHRESRGMIWLPHFHDMGLIGGLLQPVFGAFPCRVMSPMMLMKNPLNWLRQVSEFRATTSGGPNFAYDLCVRKISCQQAGELDLSCWDVAFCGAEPVRPATLRRFSEHFAPAGFRSQAFLPCYGMAETTLIATGTGKGKGITVAEGTAVVSCGHALPGTDVCIVDPDTQRPLSGGQTGEIWLRGPGIAAGYWNNAEATQATFQARLAGDERGWLRSGDLGFQQADALYVTGRMKEVLIVNGQNHYPTDIEETIRQADAALAEATVCVFACGMAHAEQPVALLELSERHKNSPGMDALAARIMAAVAERHGITLGDLLLVARRGIPRTTSGKLQRTRARTLYQQDRLAAQWRSRAVVPKPAPISGDMPQSVPALAAHIAAIIGKAVNITISEQQWDEAFTAFGLNSLQAVGVIGELEQHLERELSPSLIYDYPTINALAAALLQTAVPVTQPVAVATDNAIAIIGIGVALPGYSGVEALWSLLQQGQRTTGDIPPQRWQDSALSGFNRKGSFFERVGDFDAEYFGISPREAVYIDPQHRLLLETVQQALTDAGLQASALRGSDAAVFVGISSSDYSLACSDTVSAYSGLGNAHSIAANRISYLYDLKGPSMAVDTACSSSLVAIDGAMQSLRAGRCSLAIAGGVNLALTPHLQKIFTEAQMLAPDGRCKTFDARADGYVRGEGCGIVILKPLAQALADGDRVYATLVGSAINQDGRSNGITAPNGLSQQAVIGRAMAEAGVGSDQIDYVEAHGTGTALGDLIEYQALEAVFAERRQPSPVQVGSIKTNIGHLEAAAGVFGVVKTALMLYNRRFVPHLNYQQKNPHIASISRRVAVTGARGSSWTAAQARYAGVSSFGFGGTNGHVILRDCPAAQTAAEQALPQALLLVSSHDASAFTARRNAIADGLCALNESDVPAWCRLVNTRADHLRYRGVACGADAQQLAQSLVKLTPLRAGKPLPQVWLFPGQGTQQTGMGAALYQDLPHYRACFDRVAALVLQRYRVDITPVLNAQNGDWQRCARTCQLTLFASSYALAESLMALGLRPAAVIGHSLGEYCAAVVAGQVTLDDGLAMVHQRALLMDNLPQQGAMAVVFSGGEATRRAIAPWKGDIDIAAFNTPALTTITGGANAVEACLQAISAQGGHARRINTTHAFHSRLMDPMLPAYRDWLAQNVTFSDGTLPFYSNLDGMSRPRTDADYWSRQIRQPVRFLQGIQALTGKDDYAFIDLSADSSLGKFVASIARSQQVLPAFDHRHEYKSLITLLGTVWQQGQDVDWQKLYRAAGRGALTLPAVQFCRKTYWLAQEPPAQATSLREDAMSNQQRLRAEIKAIIAGYLSAEPETLDDGLPFLEMGADSLVLLDAINTIKDRYGVAIPVRALFEELNTLDAVIDYVATQAQPVSGDAFAEPAEPQARPAAVPVFPPVGELTTGDLQALMARQLDVMSQQLRVLGGAAELPPVPALPATGEAGQAPLQEATRQTIPAAAPAKAGAHNSWFKKETKKSTSGAERDRHLAQLTDHFVAKTGGSKRLTQQYRAVLADNRASAGFRLSTKEMLYPLVGERSQGAYIWDTDGNEYIDFTMGFGANLLGHGPECVQHAVAEQLAKGMQIGPQSALAGEVAALIAELTGQQRVAFCNSGSEAVMSAVRLARAVTGKNKVALFSGSYHGVFDGILGRQQGGEMPERATPVAPGTPPSLVEDLLVLDYGSEESLAQIARYAGQLAAVIVEPVQSRYPDHQPWEYLHALRKLTADNDIALMFDEVITGFRLAAGGAQAYYGVKADIASYGKIVGGGMPIGVIAGSARFMDGIDGGFWQYGDDSWPQADLIFFAGTFSKHPLTMAASKAVLEYIKRHPALYDDINQKTHDLAQNLNIWFAATGTPIEIVFAGSLFRFKYSGNYDILFHHLLLRGIFIWEGRNCFLSTAHTAQDIERLISAVKESVNAMRADGFFGGEGLRINTPSPAADRQQRFIRLAAQDESGLRAGNIGGVIETPRRVDGALMRQAWTLLSERHESLRMRFNDAGELWVSPDAAAVELPDEPGDPAACLSEFVARPFALAAAPPARLLMFRDAETTTLAITAHHAVADGWSFMVMLRELLHLYDALSAGQRPELTPPPSYLRFIHAEKTASDAETARRLAAFPPGRFVPADLPVVKQTAPYQGKRLKQSLTCADLPGQLRKVSAELRATRFAVLNALFILTLEQFTGGTLLPVAVPDAGRDFSGSEGLVGQCVSLMPLCLDSAACASLPEFVAVVHQAVLVGRDEPALPSRCFHGGQAPLPLLATFNIEPYAPLAEMRQWQANLALFPASAVEFPLMVNVLEMPDGLSVELDYQERYFTQENAEALLEQYLTAISLLAERGVHAAGQRFYSPAAVEA
ncbi:type I polyketide synthase [Enterobacillus tribolii]|uniref:Acyl transferase domain-containing protein n=1 Tax=Enterobacillus tribolii TaxID=1487935 RepID=A0A370R4S9_9GAMM|nr:aminotransferase class III-fold pyridoxal phosphate-dependent enzyme [Enterobacillus tribolii]RDK97434.1 acyl transferase domain-containing protein [Enterobacillus tribolii]